MAERVIIDTAKVLEVIKRATEGFQNQEGFFGEGVNPPETKFIELIREYGFMMGSEAFPLHALFFIMPPLYADNSYRYFKFASDEAQFREHVWLFDPQQAVEHEDEVEAAATDYLKPGHNRPALSQWVHNAKVLQESYGGDIRNFFAECGYEALKICESLEGPHGKADWKGFRRFGPKLSRLYLLWLEKYNLSHFYNLEKIGIPVDWQVARILIQTDAVQLDGPVHKNQVMEKGLIPLLNSPFLASFGVDQFSAAEAMWLTGSLGCNTGDHGGCPVESVCQRLISRRPLDEKGVFDPTDQGRFQPYQNRLF